ncbi:RING-box protein 2 [Frankliniella fusca]|uniref:RING-box protein 2 n=1 Tax=Frankliniella fusca TaxID=407009 RepID=A0AAE1LPN0_9NEOP|nr:RING-box protein 2 [Frankliniella fusca]
MADEDNSSDRVDNETPKPEKMFTLKKWNAVAMWSWDVECDTCAICRVQVMVRVMGTQGELGWVVENDFLFIRLA